MVATSKLNQRLDEVYKRRSEILPELANLGPDSLADSVAWLERISRPGGLGGPNPHDPVADERERLPAVESAVEDIERLSPLRHEHINLLGRYYFTLADSVRGGQLRPLRNPDELED